MICKTCKEDLNEMHFRKYAKDCKRCAANKSNKKRLMTHSQNIYDYTGMEFIVGLFIGEYDEQKFIKNYIQ